MDTQKGIRTSTIIRELSPVELEQVSGGILPIVFAVVSLASHTAVRGIGWALVQRAASIYTIYAAAAYYGGGKHRRSKIVGH